MRNAAVRALRTFVQTFIGVFLAGLIAGSVTTLGDLANLTLLDQAAAAGIVAVLTFVQNWLEESREVAYDRG